MGKNVAFIRHELFVIQRGVGALCTAHHCSKVASSRNVRHSRRMPRAVVAIFPGALSSHPRPRLQTWLGDELYSGIWCSRKLPFSIGNEWPHGTLLRCLPAGFGSASVLIN